MNTTDVQRIKKQLRQTVRDQLATLSAARRQSAAQQLCQRLGEQDFFRSAQKTLFFAPLPGEINIWPLLEQTLAAGKTLALPRFNAASQTYDACLIKDLSHDLIIGPYEIREPSPACLPTPLAEFDLIIVPGVGFDLSGHRLGRGKGYYDRLLAQTQGYKCGVAFDEQLLESIPTADHDVGIHTLITPTRCLRFK